MEHSKPSTSRTSLYSMAPTEKKQRIVFFHPDLGIGGAERLVVDAAVGLQKLGHQVIIFTSHCDPAHCFEEARDGTIDVRVRGNTIVPPSILGRFSILCAILRQVHLLLQISVFSQELQDLKPDCFFVDQLSACCPFLRIRCPKAKVLFYCHFPDKLLAQRGGFLKDLYRIPFDWLESWTTGCSDVIVVNSKFTRGIFGKAFPGLRDRFPKVVYPCVDTEQDESNEKDASEKLWKEKKVLLSVNRFERKKDVQLAIHAFAGLTQKERNDVRLVIAGGYDPRVYENVSYHEELKEVCSAHGLKDATAKNIVSAMSIPSDIEVLFLLSVPTSLKTTLIHNASLMVYTPAMEHFGIVPLEAMLSMTPVLAANTGGPTETVIDSETGWLRDTNATAEWTEVMRMALHELSDAQLKEMGRNGRSRVIRLFSQDAMAQNLDKEFQGALKLRERPTIWPSGGSLFFLMALIGFALGAMAAWSRKKAV